MSNVQREREALGLHLRQLRKDAGMSGRALAACLSWPQSKISKIETGRQTPTRADLHAWCTALDASAAAPDLIRQLNALETLYGEYRRQLRAGLDAMQRSVSETEQRARTIRAFDPALVPGLLQTPDYARARITEAAAFFGIDTDVDTAVAERMARQALLYDSKRRFHFVITEAALRYALAPPDVMLAQVDRLVSIAASRTVHLGVVPFDVRPGYAPMHGWWIYDDTLVRVETILASLTLTQPDEITMYRRAFDRLAASARHGADARRLLAQAGDRLASSAP